MPAPHIKFTHAHVHIFHVVKNNARLKSAGLILNLFSRVTESSDFDGYKGWLHSVIRVLNWSTTPIFKFCVGVAIPSQ